MLKFVSVALTLLAIQGCGDELRGTNKTYDSFLNTAFTYAGTDAINCGSGDSRDTSLISCIQNSFDNNTPTVAIFWIHFSTVTALSYDGQNTVAEYKYFEAAPERGGDGSSQRTTHFTCTEPTTNLNAISVFNVFDCKERIYTE